DPAVMVPKIGAGSKPNVGEKRWECPRFAGQNRFIGQCSMGSFRRNMGSFRGEIAHCAIGFVRRGAPRKIPPWPPAPEIRGRLPPYRKSGPIRCGKVGGTARILESDR